MDAAPRPLVVLLTGEPGSGKTTLGTALARHLRVPFLARDDVRGGLFLTEGSWTDEPGAVPTAQHAVDAFGELVIGMVGSGVSCVTEYVVRAGQEDVLDRLGEVATLVVVRTRARDALERAAARDAEDELLARPAVLGALGHEDEVARAAAAAHRLQAVADAMATTFDAPVVEVACDDGWDPPLDVVVEQVVAALG